MRLKYIIPALYLAYALYVWIDFTQLPPDGLANLGLAVAVLPVTVVGLVLTWARGETSFVLVPSGLGYYSAHAVYFWPSAILITALLYWGCSRLSRR
jgi:hypothetical protein